MTTAFISDIHGNYEALAAVLAEIDRRQVSQLACAGDIVGYYPQINECCAALQERRAVCVMGNHDWYMVSGGFCHRSKSVNDCLVFQRKIITPENLAWLASHPIQARVAGVKMVHGGWCDPIDEYLKPSSEYFAQVIGSVFLSGHTHFPTIQRFEDKLYCNPGSVGQPRDGDPRASFAIYQDGEFEICRIPYDPKPVYDLMEAAGFNDYYYGGLATGAARLTKLPQQILPTNEG
jgi:putative phosphoesterase